MPNRNISKIKIPLPDGTVTTWKAACSAYELKLGAIALSMSEMLEKFPTVQITLCMIGESYMIVDLTVANTDVVRHFLNAFACGAGRWNVTLSNYPGSKPNENRIKFNANLPLAEYKNADAIKREVDYKICLLKNTLWSIHE